MSITNSTEWFNQTFGSDLPPDVSLKDHIGLQVFKGIAMTIVIIATILGNVLVIAAIAKFRSLRSMNNYFIVSLAVADLLVGKCIVFLYHRMFMKLLQVIDFLALAEKV